MFSNIFQKKNSFISISLHFLLISLIFSFILSLLSSLLLPSCLVSSSPHSSCLVLSSFDFFLSCLSSSVFSSLSVFFLCLLSLSLPVSVCLCHVVCDVVLCCVCRCGRGVCLVCVCVFGVLCVCVLRHAEKTVENPCVVSKTPPCAHSIRLRVCRHHAHMCFNMCAWCRYTRVRFECTHGGVFESTHGGSSPVLLTKKSSRRVHTWPQRGSPK